MSKKTAFVAAYSSPELISSSHLTKDIISTCNKAGLETVFITPNQVRGISKGDIKRYKKTREEQDEYGKHVVIKSFSVKERNIVFRTIRYYSFINKAIKYLKRNFMPDFIFVWSYPPFGFAKRITKFAKKNNVKLIYDIHDIQPEILRTNRLVKKLISKSSKIMLNKSDYIFTLSNDMRESLIYKGTESKKIEVISPWNYEVNIDEKCELLDSIQNKYIVGYIGNIGNFQNIELLISVAKRMANYNDVHFVFVGSGSMLGYLKKELNEFRNVSIFEKVSENKAAILYNRCDLNVISLKKGLIKYCCPSKTPMVLKSNSDILLVTDKSHYSDYMVKDGSYFVDNYDVDSIVSTILEASKKTKNRKADKTIFDRDMSLSRWYDFFNGLNK